MRRQSLNLNVAIVLCGLIHAGAAAADLTLRYDAPAETSANGWERQSLPIGNGRIGGNFFGGLATERFSFIDITLWTGSPTVRGSYQALGNITISLPGHDAGVSEYRRELDLERAVGLVTYRKDAITYRREYFASHPDQVIIIRLSADRPGAYSGEVTQSDMHNAPTVAQGNTLMISAALATTAARGRANPPAPAATPMQYESQLAVLHDGGTVAAVENRIAFTHCNSLTLVLAAGTDYVLDPAKGFHGEAPGPRVAAQRTAAAAKPFDRLLADHVRDYQAFFGRVSYDLGTTPPQRAALPTNRRLAAYKEDPKDPGLEAMMAQYGRYLLISSSRDSLPANLQGLWCDRNNPAWQSDYHTNINIQMNYWAAETTNLSECHKPLFDLVTRLAPEYRQAVVDSARATDARERIVTARDQTPRGWTVRTESTPFGNMSYTWNKTGNAWYAQHFWEHFAFSRDEDFLRQTAYPLMKEVCHFWEDYLKELPDGSLVAPLGWSPEHGPTEDGVTYDQMIIWDLFNNTVEAADVLGDDREFRDRIAAKRDRLVKPKIGSWGQLQEWMTDRDEKGNQHRHTSHLFGVFPGRQISTSLTPELARAAAVSLKDRGEAGDSRRSWAWAWRTALWARMGDGEMAHHTLAGLLTYNTMDNLWTTHPPYQIDGNLGIAGAIPEMLVQSHAGEIHLLPALPGAWPAGSVRGLRARGGFEVDLTWAEGKLATASITGKGGTRASVRYGGKVVSLEVPAGGRRSIDGNLAVLP